MYIKVSLTAVLTERIQRRLDFFTKQYQEFERKRGFFKRKASNPHDEKLRMYAQLDKIVNPINGLREYREVFMTPAEAHELLHTIYGFEITAQAITTSSISATFKEAPRVADAVQPAPRPRRKDYPTF